MIHYIRKSQRNKSVETKIGLIFHYIRNLHLHFLFNLSFTFISLIPRLLTLLVHVDLNYTLHQINESNPATLNLIGKVCFVKTRLNQLRNYKVNRWRGGDSWVCLMVLYNKDSHILILFIVSSPVSPNFALE